MRVLRKTETNVVVKDKGRVLTLGHKGYKALRRVGVPKLIHPHQERVEEFRSKKIDFKTLVNSTLIDLKE